MNGGNAPPFFNWRNMKKILLLLLFAALLTPSSIHAVGDRDANLYFSQTPMNVRLGENFSTSLLIGSETQAVNAFEAIIEVPENLKIISANYNGSVCQFYIYQPKIYSNKIDFKCGLPHGYQGPGGLLINLNLSALSLGDSTLAISNARVLANDGFGTDVLAICDSAQIMVVDYPIASLQVQSSPNIGAEPSNEAITIMLAATNSIQTVAVGSTITKSDISQNIVLTETNPQYQNWFSQSITIIKVWYCAIIDNLSLNL